MARTAIVFAALLAAGLVQATPLVNAPLVPPLAVISGPPQTMPALVERFRLDLASLEHVYAVRQGAVRATELQLFYRQWQDALAKLPFDSFGVEDRIDWVMLNNQIGFELREQQVQLARYREVESLLPFMRPLTELTEARRLMQAQEGQASAALLQTALQEVRRVQLAVNAGADHTAAHPMATRSKTNRALQRLWATVQDLKDWNAYYTGFDPQFSWWVKRPYAELEKALGEYGATREERLLGKGAATHLDVTGDPIGRAGLVSALQREMIAYTPEELMALAERELAWGETQLRRASREMGVGDDWHAAMDKVKNRYVKPGEQTAMVRKLAKEATDYVSANGLVTVPEVARRGWRMDMLSVERQLANPFFLGGETIQVAYPTDDMTHEQKLMSMRGNNPHFARAVVHHELIPGHHLQLFMAERYQPHRRLFDTPFFVEGWAVYWEMLLYERGFAATPEDRIGMLFWRNHRAARILFSLGFHLGKLTPEQAVDMLIARVGHEPDNARAEVRRSFNGDYPPLYQAGYMIGALQMRALKRELVDGGPMTLLQYHDRILDGGMLPVELVRARLKGEKIGRDFAPAWRFYP